MAEIGHLHESTRDSLTKLTGELRTYDETYSIWLEGDEKLCDSRSPSHRIYARNRAGAEMQIGSAWLKTAKHGARAGERFLTLGIDFPGIEEPLNVAAFRDPANGRWTITWRRRTIPIAAAAAS